MACATDAIVANANGEHLDEALEVLDYIGDGGDWLKTVTNSYGGFMACMDIEADDEIASKDYYKDLKGPMAEKIRTSISEDGSFVLNEEGWCPLLNEKGLCEVCLTLGEDSLSRSMHRVSEVYNGVSENKRKSLCLSCGEVGRIVFSDTEQIGFDEQILSEDYDEYDGKMAMMSLQKNSNQ